MNLIYNATRIPSALNEQEFLCRVFGDCRSGHELDLEVGDMIGQKGPAEEKLFTYLRYNTDLSQTSLDAMGLNHILSELVQKMDKVAYAEDMQKVGITVAEGIHADHFSGFI